jgi:hypothetical protein
MTDGRIQGGIKIGVPEKLFTAFFGYQMAIRGNRHKLLSSPRYVARWINRKPFFMDAASKH